LGKGAEYRCENCGYETSLFLGIGMFYPLELGVVTEAIHHGSYGEEAKTLLDDSDTMHVAFHNSIYLCPVCLSYESLERICIFDGNDYPEQEKEPEFSCCPVRCNRGYCCGESDESKLYICQTKMIINRSCKTCGSKLVSLVLTSLIFFAAQNAICR